MLLKKISFGILLLTLTLTNINANVDMSNIYITSNDTGYIIKNGTRKIFEFGNANTLLHYDGNLFLLNKVVDKQNTVLVVQEPTSGNACNGYGDVYIIWLRQSKNAQNEYIEQLNFCGVADLRASWDKGFVKIETPSYKTPTYLDDLNLEPGPDLIIPGQEYHFTYTW